MEYGMANRFSRKPTAAEQELGGENRNKTKDGVWNPTLGARCVIFIDGSNAGDPNELFQPHSPKAVDYGSGLSDFRHVHWSIGA